MSLATLILMLLAELEIFHSRQAQPTRRVALGNIVLPVEPAPGLGGILLGAVIAKHARELSSDDHIGLKHLIRDVGDGRRILQPRMRNRYQVDRHGLASSTHRLIGEGDEMSFEFADRGGDLAQVLGAIYAVERIDQQHRGPIAEVLTNALRWKGPIGPAMVAFLAGAQSSSLAALADPRAWALERLGFPESEKEPSSREVSRRYRQQMRNVHPDHGAAHEGASAAIRELAEARRILTQT